MKHIVLIALSCIVLYSCKTEVDPFLINTQNIGLLTDSTQVKDLKTIFANDSIVKFIGGDEFIGTVNDIEIFEKGGAHLLTLSAREALDSTSTISTITIKDERYKTPKGLSTLSTFKDIAEQYKISKITNTLNNVVVFVDEINAFFTIDKKELTTTIRYNQDAKVSEKDIPDQAKIKYFMIGWSN